MLDRVESIPKVLQNIQKIRKLYLVCILQKMK